MKLINKTYRFTNLYFAVTAKIDHKRLLTIAHN